MLALRKGGIFLVRKYIHKASLGLLAVMLFTVGVTSPALAQTTTPLQAKIALRPLTRGDIAAFKLPSALQISAGLTNIGVGEPAYLEVQTDAAVKASDIASVTWELSLKPAGSKATLADSPLGKDVPVY